MTLSEEDIYQTLKNFFPTFSIDEPLVRIGGHNNTNYSVTINGNKYFVKVGNRSENLVGSSIQNEVECMKMASYLDICPQLVFYDPQKSVLVTEFIEGDFQFDQMHSKNRYINLLHTLHRSNIQFKSEFCPFKTIQNYTELSNQRNVCLPDTLTKKIIPTVLDLKKEQLLIESISCHLDPQFYNILDSGSQLYLVDWEFGAMCDPLFDLASMCASEELTDDDMKELLGLYLERTPTDVEWKRFYTLRVIADIRMCLFCYLYTSITTDSPNVYIDVAEVFLEQIELRFPTMISFCP